MMVSQINELKFFSTNIESVVDETTDKVSNGVQDAMCTACEMMVVWMQNRIKLNQTEDQILNYVNEVSGPFYFTFLWRKMVLQ